MEIYLIRHTAPAIAKGVCYGQADLDVRHTFANEAAIIQQHLPVAVGVVYSSPLQRCEKLARHLFAGNPIQLHNDLMEINCGEWELRPWDDIPKKEIDPWMNDYVNVRIPGGESYTDVYERVANYFNSIMESSNHLANVRIVAHGGVIRSILSYITQTPLIDSFKAFSLHYGCVIKIVKEQGGLRHEVLSNIAHEKETHKPASK